MDRFARAPLHFFACIAEHLAVLGAARHGNEEVELVREVSDRAAARLEAIYVITTAREGVRRDVIAAKIPRAAHTELVDAHAARGIVDHDVGRTAACD